MKPLQRAVGSATHAMAAGLFLLVVAWSCGATQTWGGEQLQLTAGENRTEGTWRMDAAALKRPRQSGVSLEIRQGNSTFGRWVAHKDFAGLPEKLVKGGAVEFSIVAEPGNLEFTGVSDGRSAKGSYQFKPNADFAAEAGRLLKRDLANADLLDLAFSQVTLAYIRDVQAAGVAADYDGILRLKSHGVTAEAVRDYAKAEFRDTGEIVKLRNHGANPAFASAARELGHGKSADEVIMLRNHGVTAEYLRDWKRAGFNHPSPDVVKLRNHGVQPEYGAAWKGAGFVFTTDELIRARNHGVPADFPGALATAGPKPSLEEAIRLRQYGVTAEYFREVKKANKDYTVEEVVRFRQHGVQPDYIRAMADDGGFSAEQIVQLRNHGVPADYVKAVNIPGRAPLDTKAIIDLRNRGVSAETARKLRE